MFFLFYECEPRKSNLHPGMEKLISGIINPKVVYIKFGGILRNLLRAYIEFQDLKIL